MLFKISSLSSTRRINIESEVHAKIGNKWFTKSVTNTKTQICGIVLELDRITWLPNSHNKISKSVVVRTPPNGLISIQVYTAYTQLYTTNTEVQM
jgi:hypothetical protein